MYQCCIDVLFKSFIVKIIIRNGLASLYCFPSLLFHVSHSVHYMWCRLDWAFALNLLTCFLNLFTILSLKGETIAETSAIAQDRIWMNWEKKIRQLRQQQHEPDVCVVGSGGYVCPSFEQIIVVVWISEGEGKETWANADLIGPWGRVWKLSSTSNYTNHTSWQVVTPPAPFMVNNYWAVSKREVST